MHQSRCVLRSDKTDGLSGVAQREATGHRQRSIALRVGTGFEPRNSLRKRVFWRVGSQSNRTRPAIWTGMMEQRVKHKALMSNEKHRLRHPSAEPVCCLKSWRQDLNLRPHGPESCRSVSVGGEDRFEPEALKHGDRPQDREDSILILGME